VRSYSSSLVSTRPVARVVVCRIEPRAEFIFLLHRKIERFTESLTDASQLAGSGRLRIVGPTRACDVGVAHVARIFPLRTYINPCSATAAYT
jgi:hypothetical protein